MKICSVDIGFEDYHYRTPIKFGGFAVYEATLLNVRITGEIKSGKKYYSKEQVDFFAVWHEKHKGFFILPNNGQKAFRLCVTNKYKDNFNNFNIIL